MQLEAGSNPGSLLGVCPAIRMGKILLLGSLLFLITLGPWPGYHSSQNPSLIPAHLCQVFLCVHTHQSIHGTNISHLLSYNPFQNRSFQNSYLFFSYIPDPQALTHLSQSICSVTICQVEKHIYLVYQTGKKRWRSTVLKFLPRASTEAMLGERGIRKHISGG